MKILITGMNKNQCIKDFYKGQHLKVIPSHYSLIRCLEDMGHEVEQRHVQLGENLNQYDKVIAFVHSVGGFCQFLWNGLYTFSAVPENKLVIAFDDWQISKIADELTGYKNALVNDPDKAFRKYFYDLWPDKDDSYKDYKQAYIDGIDRIYNGGYSNILISAFKGGDWSKFKFKNVNFDSSKVVYYNPNPYHLNRDIENNFHSHKGLKFDKIAVTDKAREWNFASLLQNQTKKWLKDFDISWYINYYGQLKNAPEGSKRLTEDLMCYEFYKMWGSLMPGYEHSGSGWWRARPLQVADAGSILIGDKEELMVYYRDEALSSLTPSDIEGLDDLSLQKIAEGQYSALYDNHPLLYDYQKAEIAQVL